MSQRRVLVVGETAQRRAIARRLLSIPEGETFRFGEARSCAVAVRRLQCEKWNSVALCEPLGEGSMALRRFLKNDGVAVIIIGVTEALPPEEILGLLVPAEAPLQ